MCLLPERWDGEISEGGGGEDAKGNNSLLFPGGNQLGSTDRISQVQLLFIPVFMLHWFKSAGLTSSSCVCSETFSFVLTEIDGSRRNGYCRRLLVSVD